MHTPRLFHRVTGLLALSPVRALVGATGVAALLVVAANVGVQRSAAPYSYEHAAEVPARPVALVLGARVWADGRPSHVLEDRLHAALTLYQAGKVGRILVSGDGSGRNSPSETRVMASWLTARGVPKELVQEDPAGFRTLDSMVNARDRFAVHGAVICTQRFHLARSVVLARQLGIDAIGLVSDRRVYRKWVVNELRELVARPVAVADLWLR